LGAILATSSYVVGALLYPIGTLVVVAWILFGVVRAGPVGERPPSGGWRLRGSELRNVRPLLAFLTALLLAQVSFAAGFNFSSLRIAGLGGGALLVATAASLQAVAEVPAMAWMTRLRAVFAPRHFYVAGCGIYALVLLFWAVTKDPTSVAIAFFVVRAG
jgi:hypothetical protein